jgi:hypothetical protein
VLCQLPAPPPRLRALIRWAPAVILVDIAVCLGLHRVTEVLAGLRLGLPFDEALPLTVRPQTVSPQTLSTSTPAALNAASSASPASSSVMRV